MAEGRIVFSIDADDKAAHKKLNDLQRDIEKTAKAIDKTASNKSGIEKQLDSARESAKALQKEMDAIQEARAVAARTVSGNAPGRARLGAAVDPAAYAEAAEQMRELDAKAAELAPKIQIAEKDVVKLEAAEQRVNDKLEAQTAAMQQQKAALVAQERTVLRQATSAMPAVREAAEQSAAAIKSGFKNILKWGIGIRSVFALMRKLRNAIKEGITEFAKADPATKATLDSLKNMLQTLKASWGAAFAPILQAVAPILQKLIGWLTTAANAVQQFFAVLSGKTTYKVAKATEALADGYKAAGGAAKDAQKQIMGFDEINKLNEESSGGGGGGGAAGIEAQELPIETGISRIAKNIQDNLAIIEFAGGAAALALGLILTFTGANVPLGLGLIAVGALSLSKSLSEDWGFISSKVIGAVMEIVAYVSTAFIAIGALLVFSGANIALGLGLIAAGIAGGAAIALSWDKLPEQVRSSVSSILAIVGAAALALGVILLLTGANVPLGIGMILAGAASLGASVALNWDFLKEKVSEICEKVKEIWGDFWDKLTDKVREGKERIAEIAAKIGDLFNDLWQGIADKAKEVWSGILQFLTQAWGTIQTAADAYFKPIGEFFSNLWAQIWQTTETTWDSIVKMFNEVWDSITRIFSGIIDFIAGVFTGDWSRAWQGIIDIFGGIWDGITGVMKGVLNVGISILEGFINYIISGVNAILAGVSGMASAVASVLGLGEVNMQLGYVNLPRLARGGIVDAATPFIAGEAGKEAVIPLERNTEWIGMVAGGLIDKLTAGNQLADYITGRVMPAVVTGQLVPPRATSGASGGILTDADRAFFADLLLGAVNRNGGDGDGVTRLYLDGRVIAETVSKHQRLMERAYGV